MTPLERAISQLGVVEEHGNRGIPFSRYALLGEEPAPWCARGLRWCFEQSGKRLPGNRWLLGSCLEMLSALQDRGAVLHHKAEIEPGDLVFLKDRGDSDKGSGHHVAIVEVGGSTMVTSIDFNWGDKVQRVDRARYAPSIACFCRWPVRPTA